jgi:hypothetical protein
VRNAVALTGILWILVAVCPGKAKDISADTLAVLHDVLAPYRGDRAQETAQGRDERAAALTSALDALRREKLLDLPRPQVKPLVMAEQLGQALGLGRRTVNFLTEIAAVRDALVQQDETAAQHAIQTLYGKMGRTKPEGAALVPLIAAARKVVGAVPQETDRTEIEGPGYTIVVENARAAGKARVSVLMTKGPGGRPARVAFGGSVTTRPDAKGADLTTHVTPAATPDIVTAAEAEELEKKLSGKWRDKRGGEYNITINGETVVVAHLNPVGLVPPQVRHYRGTYRVGVIRARFEINRPEELHEALPIAVREQLARRNFGFDIRLDAQDRGAKLDGTWSSQHVTYSPDRGHPIDKVHRPYDVALVLTRTDRPRLRLVERTDGTEREIKGQLTFFGGPVIAELRFETEQADAEKTIMIEWGAGQGEGRTALLARRSTADPLLYRTDQFFILPTAPRQQNGRAPVPQARSIVEP